VKFGLIPEFVGRVPICVSLRGLDREALIRILQEPKNALVKQYQKLFQMDHVKLDFEQDAIEAIADKALERKTGARGLRSIMESVMMDTMYEIPSDDTIEECVVTKAAVDGASHHTRRFSEKGKIIWALPCGDTGQRFVQKSRKKKVFL